MKKILRRIFEKINIISLCIGLPVWAIALLYELIGRKKTEAFLGIFGISLSAYSVFSIVILILWVTSLILLHRVLLFEHERTAIQTAKTYIKNDTALTDRYGEKCKYEESRRNIPEDIENGKTAHISFTVRKKHKELAEYELTLIYRNGIWNVTEANIRATENNDTKNDQKRGTNT